MGNNNDFIVSIAYKGNDQYHASVITRTISIYKNTAPSIYDYYNNHNYGDNLKMDDYIYDNYWDEEIYDDSYTYDGEGY